MEIIKLVLLGLGLIEGLVICYEQHWRNRLLKWNNSLIDIMNKAQELEKGKKARRDIEGTFKNAMQDGYRKNDKGQYVPVKPNSNPYAIRPHLGDDEDEV